MIHTLTPSTHLEVLASGDPVRDVELGETLTIRAGSFVPVRVECVSHPGSEPAIDDLTITPAARGLHKFRLYDAADRRMALTVFAFDAACTEWIPIMQRSGTPQPRTMSERRAVIRSIVQHHASDAAWFDGSVESLHNRPLQLFGA